MTFTRALRAGLFSLLAAAPLGAQAPGELHLEINIPTLQLIVYEGDRVLRTYPVAVGKKDHPTIEGSFEITHAEWNPWWRPPPGREWTRGREITPPGPQNPMGRVKLFFEPLYFIHGTSEAESIGSAASHGCVRMRNSDVIALGRLLQERGGANVSASEMDRILAQPRTTRHVRLSRPIPLAIHYSPVVVHDGELQVHPDLYGRRAVHVESVFQALLAAGYDPGAVQRSAVQDVLKRAQGQKGVFRVKLDEVFGQLAAVGGS
ncbi:hypothetical protein BH23GEM7_BH23GEM7_23240 [soil metagenome]